MMEAALIALLIRQEWFCSSGLEPGLDYALRLGFELTADGSFDGYGISYPLSAADRFDWAGSWTLVDGQLAMIGQTSGHSSGVAPATELRAIARVTEQDVIILDAAESDGWADVMRCLTYKFE